MSVIFWSQLIFVENGHRQFWLQALDILWRKKRKSYGKLKAFL